MTKGGGVVGANGELRPAWRWPKGFRINSAASDSKIA